MKHYSVPFSEDAIAEFASSIEWGRETWGEEEALAWYADIRNSIRQLLSSFPLSQPIAPDNNQYEVEVRQMLIGRYRVLFNVTHMVVTLLHIRGPYTG